MLSPEQNEELREWRKANPRERTGPDKGKTTRRCRDSYLRIGGLKSSGFRRRIDHRRVIQCVCVQETFLMRQSKKPRSL